MISSEFVVMVAEEAFKSAIEVIDEAEDAVPGDSLSDDFICRTRPFGCKCGDDEAELVALLTVCREEERGGMTGAEECS